MILEIRFSHLTASGNHLEPFKLIEIPEKVSLQRLGNKFKAKNRNVKRNTKITCFALVNDDFETIKWVEV